MIIDGRHGVAVADLATGNLIVTQSWATFGGLSAELPCRHGSRQIVDVVDHGSAATTLGVCRCCGQMYAMAIVTVGDTREVRFRVLAERVAVSRKPRRELLAPLW